MYALDGPAQIAAERSVRDIPLESEERDEDYMTPTKKKRSSCGLTSPSKLDPEEYVTHERNL